MNKATLAFSVIAHVLLFLLLHILGVGEKQGSPKQDRELQAVAIHDLELESAEPEPEPEPEPEVNQPNSVSPGGNSEGPAAVDDIPITTEISPLISSDVLTSPVGNPSQIISGIGRAELKGPTLQTLNLGADKTGSGNGKGKGIGNGNGSGYGNGSGLRAEMKLFGRTTKTIDPVFLIVDLSGSMKRYYKKIESFISQYSSVSLFFTSGTYITQKDIVTHWPRRPTASLTGVSGWEGLPVYASCSDAFDAAANQGAKTIFWISDFLDLRIQHDWPASWPKIHSVIMDNQIVLHIFSLGDRPPPIIMQTVEQSNGELKVSK